MQNTIMKWNSDNMLVYFTALFWVFIFSLSKSLNAQHKGYQNSLEWAIKLKLELLLKSRLVKRKLEVFILYCREKFISALCSSPRHRNIQIIPYTFMEPQDKPSKCENLQIKHLYAGEWA